MDLYYAAGGGLGHITRADRVLRTLGIDATIVTTSPYADRCLGVKSPMLRIPGFISSDRGERAPSPALTDTRVDRAELIKWLDELIEKIRPSRIFIDTFPAGLFGELPDVATVRESELHYVGRLLRWDSYSPLIGATPLCFESALLLELLTPEHDLFIRRTSVVVENLSIEDDEEGDADPEAKAIWVVSHSGPADEVRTLVHYAMEMRQIEQSEAPIVLTTMDPPPDLPPDISIVSRYPARSLFASATRIITGAGFNSMWELRKHRHKHRFIAFPRRFDDQFLRARRARNDTAHEYQPNGPEAEKEKVVFVDHE
ncbi:MAG TPA: hypothetical protein VHL58_20335 [Thermoanaerobaculia bacterium]|nr:hypothetical protein [Thermoanaerobaculia bacterium]